MLIGARVDARAVHVNVKDHPTDEVGHVKNDEPFGEQHEHVGCAQRVIELVFEFDHECLVLSVLRVLLVVVIVIVVKRNRTVGCKGTSTSATTTTASTRTVSLMMMVIPSHIGGCVQCEHVCRMHALYAHNRVAVAVVW